MKKLLVTICLAALIGCTVKDASYPSMVDAYEAWTNKTIPVNDAAVQERWWQQFNDPELNNLIQTAEAQNLDVKIAQARVRAARAQLISTEAGFLPNITGAASAGRSRLSTETATGAGLVTPTANLYDAEIDATWEVNVFQISPATKAAEATLKSAEESQNAAILSLLGEVASNYIELRRLQTTLGVTNNSITAYQTSLSLAQARQQAGLTTGLDTVRAEALLETQQAQQPALATQINAAIRRIEVLLGQNPGTLDTQLAPPSNTPVMVPVANSPLLLATPVAVIANRPDVRGAEENLIAANAEKNVASAEYFPSLSLPAAFGWQAERVPDLFTGSGLVWALAGGVNVPIFDFGRIRADVDLADADAQQAFFQYQKTVQGALSDVETALSDYLASVNRAPQLDRAVVDNQTAVDLSEERYKQGLSNFLDVTTAQQALYTAQTDQIQNQADMASRLVTLYKAMGGGWQNEKGALITSGASTPAAPAVAAVPAVTSAPAAVSAPAVSNAPPAATAIAPSAPVNPPPNAPHVTTEKQKNNTVMVIE